ncbi:hypothetical protein [Bacillus marinisedimentorum]|uniref:hypothetical protein n=1 Tax=Bacillus marinisedimentorum TaxID=1821260 RepID=UPI000872370A|nr:hypothetical protein [Bacillus marinisedimentorum]
MNKVFTLLVFIGVPVSVAGGLLNWEPAFLFVIYSATIIAFASFMGRAAKGLAVAWRKQV